MAYTLNFRSSRARARTSVRSARIPGALSGLRRRQREEGKIEGASLRERGTRKETDRERERERGIRNWTESVSKSGER